MKIGPATVMLSDEYPEHGMLALAADSHTSVLLHIHRDNVGQLFECAVKTGASVVRPLADHFYGERSGTVRHPFGHDWMLGAQFESVTPDEMQRRYMAMFERWRRYRSVRAADGPTQNPDTCRRLVRGIARARLTTFFWAGEFPMPIIVGSLALIALIYGAARAFHAIHAAFGLAVALGVAVLVALLLVAALAYWLRRRQQVAANVHGDGVWTHELKGVWGLMRRSVSGRFISATSGALMFLQICSVLRCEPARGRHGWR